MPFSLYWTRVMHLKWEEMMTKYFPDPKTRDEAYWKTLIADRNKRNHRAKDEMRASFNAWRQFSRLGEFKELPRDTNWSLWEPLKPFREAHIHAI